MCVYMAFLGCPIQLTLECPPVLIKADRRGTPLLEHHTGNEVCTIIVVYIDMSCVCYKHGWVVESIMDCGFFLTVSEACVYMYMCLHTRDSYCTSREVVQKWCSPQPIYACLHLHTSLVAFPLIVVTYTCACACIQTAAVANSIHFYT